jgi:branched-chain amino acid transport system permease protein
MLSEIIQALVGGLLLGGVYGLAAFGLSLTFGVMNFLNLAHGEFLVLGGFLGAWAFSSFGLNPFLGALAVIPVFLASAIPIHRLFIRPLEDLPRKVAVDSSIVVTIGLSLVISDTLSFLVERPVAGIPFSLPPLEFGVIIVSSLRLAVVAFVLVCGVCLRTFLARTDTGRSIRAIVDCREGASIVGVPVDRLSALTFGFGTSLAAMAGVFFATLFTVNPVMGPQLTVKCLCVIVLGGLGSVTGSLYAGMVLGATETLTALFIGPEWAPCPAFVLLIFILTLRPKGIMSGRS